MNDSVKFSFANVKSCCRIKKKLNKGDDMGINANYENAKKRLMDAACNQGYLSIDFLLARENAFMVMEEEIRKDLDKGVNPHHWLDLENPIEDLIYFLEDGNDKVTVMICMEDYIRFVLIEEKYDINNMPFDYELVSDALKFIKE